MSCSQMWEKAGDRKGRGFQCECTHLEGKGGVLSCVSRARRPNPVLRSLEEAALTCQ